MGGSGRTAASARAKLPGIERRSARTIAAAYRLASTASTASQLLHLDGSGLPRPGAQRKQRALRALRRSFMADLQALIFHPKQRSPFGEVPLEELRHRQD